MDFPKTCSTNVLRVDSILTYTYATYACHAQLDEMITQLRRDDILCCAVQARIWAFNQADDLSLVVTGLQLQEQGTLQDLLDKNTSDTTMDVLVAAVKAGIAYKLATTKQIYSLGQDILVSASTNDTFSHESSVFRLSAKQYDPGCLQFTISPVRAKIRPLSALPAFQGARLVLCPAGIHAIAIDGAQDSQQYATSPSAAEQEWRVAVHAKLLLHGIILGVSPEWTHVYLEDDPTASFTWPSDLCYAKVPLVADSDWAATTDMLDPLAFAEQWVDTAAERQQSILLEQHGRPVQTGAVGFSTDDMDIVASPPFLNRPDLINAAGVYPTPPDGMLLPPVTHLPSQVESQIDSTMPSQQEAAATDGDDLFRLQTHDGDETIHRDGRDSIVSSMRDSIQHSAQDDLFGGPVAEYGGGEVEDNDFDFFDDQTAGMLASHSEPPSLSHEPSLVTATPQENKTQLDTDIIMADIASTPFTAIDTSTTDVEETPAPSGTLLTTPADAAPRYKPLSPFEIREKLLPPPIPASQASQFTPEARRGSFAPIKFNPDLHISTRLQSFLKRDRSSISLHDASDLETSHGTPPRPEASNSPTRVKVESQWSDSDDDSSDDASGVQQTQLPHLPWHDRKRKRVASVDDANLGAWTVQAMPTEPDSAMQDMPGMLTRVITAQHASFAPAKAISERPERLKKYFSGIKPPDMAMIAQVIAEQAASCTTKLLADLEPLNFEHDGQIAHHVEYSIRDALQRFLGGAKDIDVGSIALQREPARLEPVKGQPRPPLRLDITPTQELYPLAAPYLCLQRGDVAMQMLPPAVHFWEALSLSPSNGSKDMQPYYITPSGTDLTERLRGFNDDLRAAYEGGKLGNVRDAPNVLTIWSGSVDDTDDERLYCDYLKLCKGLITALAEEAYKDPHETSVIFVVDPFNNTNRPFRQLIAALFWKIYAGYRDKIARGKPAKDISLQLLPVGLVYSPKRLSFLSSNQMAVLAREIYDKCPPGENAKLSSPLPIVAAPALVLAEAVPKRIGFQLTANTPADLLYDGSELHVAYAKSIDGFWITVVWADNTGCCLHTEAFCLRGTSSARIFAEIWTRTLDIAAKRPVSWRISIATEHDLTDEEIQCWKEVLVPPKQKKGGAIHVSLVTSRTDPVLRVKGPPDREGAQTATTAGVITPVGTPQAAGFTVSPDASGIAAPPTPAPTEPTSEEAEGHLVDLPDETWGMLLDPKYDLVQSTASGYRALAQGALVKYGDKESAADLPVLGISILFTLRLRSMGASVPMEEATSKQAEIVLRELLTAFRGLGLLAKARGLQSEKQEGVPLHTVVAAAAAEALTGLLA